MLPILIKIESIFNLNKPLFLLRAFTFNFKITESMALSDLKALLNIYHAPHSDIRFTILDMSIKPPHPSNYRGETIRDLTSQTGFTGSQ